MTDADYVLATAHFVQQAAKDPRRRAGALAAYARRRVTEILAERAEHQRGESDG